MELVKIATGDPITREQIEADWIAAQPATVTVEQEIDGETVPVEIENHVDFRLPGDLTGIDLAVYGAAIVEPVEPPETDPGEVAERDGSEQYEPGKWRMVWTVRPMTAEEKKALVPVAITARQARIVLSRHGLLAAAETALAAMPGQAGDEARIEWEYASEFRRDHPLIAALAAALGLAEEAVDAMFIEGSMI